MNEKKIKEIIDKYLKFECPDIDGKSETPYVIVAPARGDQHLRVYAYGGFAGGIGCEGQAKCKRASKDYVDYLKDTYTDGQGHEYNVPDWLDVENPVELWANRSGLELNSYLKLTAAALQNRARYHDERREQTCIARKFMDIKPADGSMLVTDIEYVAPKIFTGKVKERIYAKHELWKKDNNKGRKSLLKNAEPDFILFDGKSFGIVEFKYNGKSMDANIENSLREHLLDFANVLATEKDSSRNLNDWKTIPEESDDFKRALEEEGRGNIETAEKIRMAQWELFGDCCNNMDKLLKYALIPEEWGKALCAMKEKYDKNHENGAFDASLLWCGFLFVGGDEKYIKNKVILQLKDFKDSELDIRYQYSKDLPEELTMKESLRSILKSAE